MGKLTPVPSQERPQLDEARFEQAVRLAAAFVANGDIRDHGKHPEAQLEDLIPRMYNMLAEARAECVAAGR